MSDTSPTLRYVVYDILGDLKQLYSEAEITPYKVAYWVLVFADTLRRQHMQKIDSGAFTHRFDVDVHVDGITGRNYIEIPKAIYDFDKDDGIDYITYAPGVDPDLPGFASVTFTRTTPSQSARLYFRDEEKPSPSNPYFYRLNSYIWLLGVESISITQVEAGLKTTLAITDLNLDLDVVLDLPVHLIPSLKFQILNLGRFVLQIPRDLLNDGSSVVQGKMPKDKIVTETPQNQSQE